MTVKPLQHTVFKRAVATLQHWAKTINSGESLTLLKKAEEDWQDLGVPEPTVKAEPAEPKKRTLEICAVFTPKRRCVDPVIPQPDDLELIQVCLMNTVSRVYISWFVRGTFQVDIRQGDRQSCTLLCRMQALPSKESSNPPSGAGEVIRDPEVIKVLGDLLGLPLEDLICEKHPRECQEKFSLPNQASMTKEEFGAPGVLPAESLSQTVTPLSTARSPHLTMVLFMLARGVNLGNAAAVMSLKEWLVSSPTIITKVSRKMAPHQCRAWLQLTVSVRH